jgi:hypothetical protein
LQDARALKPLGSLPEVGDRSCPDDCCIIAERLCGGRDEVQHGFNGSGGIFLMLPMAASVTRAEAQKPRLF